MNKKIKKYFFITCTIILILEMVFAYNSKKSNAADIYTSNIGVSLVENGTIISKRDYAGDGQWNGTTEGEFSGELFELEPTMIQFGKKYKEEMCVQNTGAIDEYVRVIITKKWIDADGKKNNGLNSEFIRIETNNQENWIITEDKSIKERYVMYYKKIIPSGEYSTNFIDNIIIDPEVIKKYEIEEEITTEGKVITMKSLYDNNSVDLNIEVDAVQTHNAEEAMKSAWGVIATIDENGNITNIK